LINAFIKVFFINVLHFLPGSAGEQQCSSVTRTFINSLNPLQKAKHSSPLMILPVMTGIILLLHLSNENGMPIKSLKPHQKEN